MPLVAARCKNCNGDLQIDSLRKEGFCVYCGTKYITEDVINYYNTVNNNYIQNATFINGKSERDVLLDGLAQIKMKNYRQASETFNEFTINYPRNWKGYLGRAIAGFLCCESDGVQLSEEEWNLFPTFIQNNRQYIQYLSTLSSQLYNENHSPNHAENELSSLENHLQKTNHELEFINNKLKEDLAPVIGYAIFGIILIGIAFFLPRFYPEISKAIIIIGYVIGAFSLFGALVPLIENHRLQSLRERKTKAETFKKAFESQISQQTQYAQQTTMARHQRIQQLSAQIQQTLQNLGCATVNDYYITLLEQSIKNQ